MLSVTDHYTSLGHHSTLEVLLQDMYTGTQSTGVGVKRAYRVSLTCTLATQSQKGIYEVLSSKTCALGT